MFSWRKLIHAEVDYGPGHAPEFCHTCMYSDSTIRLYSDQPKPTCKLVVDIEPNGWCVLWTNVQGKGMR